jgi:hypothetical protein
MSMCNIDVFYVRNFFKTGLMSFESVLDPRLLNERSRARRSLPVVIEEKMALPPIALI